MRIQKGLGGVGGRGEERDLLRKINRINFYIFCFEDLIKITFFLSCRDSTYRFLLCFLFLSLTHSHSLSFSLSLFFNPTINPNQSEKKIISNFFDYDHDYDYHYDFNIEIFKGRKWIYVIWYFLNVKKRNKNENKRKWESKRSHDSFVHSYVPLSTNPIALLFVCSFV